MSSHFSRKSLSTMSEYIDIPHIHQQRLAVPSSSYGRPDVPAGHGRPDISPSYRRPELSPSSYGRQDIYQPSSSVPRVTRLSYSPNPNHPSWMSNSAPPTRPNSSPLAPANSSAPSHPTGEADNSMLQPPRPPYASPNPEYDAGRPSWVSPPYLSRPGSTVPPNGYGRMTPAGPRYPSTSRAKEPELRLRDPATDEEEEEDEEMEQEYISRSEGRHEYEYEHETDMQSGPYDEEDDEEEENMTVDIGPNGAPSAQSHHGPTNAIANELVQPLPPNKPKQSFVGGFFAGLKRIPKAMVKNNPRPRTPPSTAASLPPPAVLPVTGRTANLPKWEERVQGGVNLPSQNITRIEMPTIDLSHTTDTTSPRNSDPQGHPRDVDPEVPPALPNPHEQELLSPVPLETPVEIKPLPTEDYSRMSGQSSAFSPPYSSSSTSRTYPSYPEDSFRSHFNRIGRFISNLKGLPWISSHVAVDYRPADAHRAQYDKPIGSWYSPEGHEKLDLLAAPQSTPAPSKRPAVRRRHHSQPPEADDRRNHHHHHHHHHDGVAAVRPSRGSATSGGVGPTSPGASSGMNPYAYNYYYQQPHPVYVYPTAAVSPPRVRSPDGQAVMSSIPEQAVPVYMLAPAPLVVPSSPPKGSRPTHVHQTFPKASPVSSPPIHITPAPNVSLPGKVPP
ncbi:hypothetical protein ABKN59_003572 [Abortiporus biennis]